MARIPTREPQISNPSPLWDVDSDCGAQLLAVQEAVVAEYRSVEKKWSKAKGKQHRQHVCEMQEIEQKLAARRQAGSADEEVEYKDTVSA